MSLKVPNIRGPGVGLTVLDIFLEAFINYYYIFITVFVMIKISKYFR